MLQLTRSVTWQALKQLHAQPAEDRIRDYFTAAPPALRVLLIPNVITPALLYLAAIVIGSLITGLGYAAIKRGAAPVAVGAST